MKIILLGQVPSKKNARNIFVCKGRIINIPSAIYKKWNDSQTIIMKKNFPEKPKNCSAVNLKFFNVDKRKRDLSNMAESIMDLMVECGKIEDDNCFVINEVKISFGGVDKANPRCEIELCEN